MSWASRRRILYLIGVTLFFAIVLGGPLAYIYFSIPATCEDGTMNQGETAVDKGGPCPVLDEWALQPHAVLWARSFRVRDGSYNAAAYIQNPNKNAGVLEARYRFGLYDAQNILVAEREGIMYIMPSGVTPIIESRINTGNRIVARTYFEFTGPLTWRRLDNAASVIRINNKQVLDAETTPRVTADAQNTSVADMTNVSFAAVVFDPAGNAFAVSATAVSRISAGVSVPLTFTWPDAFDVQVGRIDILPSAVPSAMR